MNTMNYPILTSSLFALLLAPCGAVVVANYDLTTITDPNESTETFLSASVDTDTDSTASDITSPATHNDGAVHPEFGDVYNNGGNQAIGWSARGNNPAQTFSINLPIDTYFSFDVSAVGGATLNLSSLSVLTGVSTSLGNLTAFDYTLSYSTDGTTYFSAGTVAAGTNPGDAATISANGTATATISYDLSGIGALQGITGTAYFRLDPVASGNQNGVQSQRAGFIDNLVVNATVIPEPTTSLLGFLGLLGVFRRRR